MNTKKVKKKHAIASHKTIEDEESQILPVGWRKCWSVRKARVYYFNIETAESSWERPNDVTDLAQMGLFQDRDDAAEQPSNNTEVVVPAAQTNNVQEDTKAEATMSKVLGTKSHPSTTKEQLQPRCRKRTLSSTDSVEKNSTADLSVKRRSLESRSEDDKLIKTASSSDKNSAQVLLPENKSVSHVSCDSNYNIVNISHQTLCSKKLTQSHPTRSDVDSQQCDQIKSAVKLSSLMSSESSASEQLPDIHSKKCDTNLLSQEITHSSRKRSSSESLAVEGYKSFTHPGSEQEDGSLTPKRMARIQMWVASLDSEPEGSASTKPQQGHKIESSKNSSFNTDREQVVEADVVADEDMDVDAAEVDIKHEQMEIIQDVLEMREVLQLESEKATGDLTEQLLGPQSSQTQSFVESSLKKMLCVVIDTNVLLEDLNFIDDLKDQKFKGLGRPCLVIPWVVLQELDAIKDSRCITQVSLSLRTQSRARSAVNFLHACLQAKHPRVIFQAPGQAQEPSDIEITCNDDKILQACLQVKRGNSQEVVLLTMDKNLRNKAMVLNIPTYSKESLVSWLQYLQPNNEDSGKKQHTNNRLEQNLGDELQCDARKYLRTTLSVILEVEMKEAYGNDLWSTIVLKKPPWTMLDVLDCVYKHWIAVFGHVVPRESKQYLTCLRDHFHPSKGSFKSLEEVGKMLNAATKLLQSFRNHSQYEGSLDEPIEKLTYLERVCEGVCSGSFPAQSLASLLTLIPQVNANNADSDYYDPSSPTTDTGVSELDFMGVQHAFQTIWEAILYFRECMEQRLAQSLNAASSVRSGNVTSFIRFFSAVLLIRTAYNRMLAVKDVEVNASLTTFCQLCHALNNFAHNFDIQPWQPISGDKLKNFFLEDKSRGILRNGFLQLEQLIAGIDQSKKLLLSNEVALVNAIKLQNL